MFACYTAADELMLRLLSMLGSPSKLLTFCELPRMVEGEETSAPNVSVPWGERTSLSHDCKMMLVWQYLSSNVQLDLMAR